MDNEQVPEQGFYLESLLKLPVISEHRIRILQITDTHLFADRHQDLLGVQTCHSYHAVLDAILAQQYPFDLVVATGDLAQDQSLTAYQHFAKGVARLSVPCVWLPGNHDVQPIMTTALIQSGLPSSKHILLGHHWHIILLDSHVPGVPYGKLSDPQLTWMEHCLLAYPQRYVLILLHHHLGSSGCLWLDQHSLQNAHQLAEILMRYSTVNTLVCGHIHQEMDYDWHGLRLLASPSTCVQFKPHCTNFTLDILSPGWRYLDLLPHGKIETHVHRLAGDAFIPHTNPEGY